MIKEPLVSVLTPVYNGEKYLAECIESVLAQTHPNFEYIIVNNASTDRTLEIASDYAKKDKRIRVCSNAETVGVIENHNIAFRQISPESRYCKVVSGDDWLFPDCLRQMTSLAEANPSVGIVGSYQLSGGGSNGRHWQVRWDEIPYPSPVVSGREICRSRLLGGPYVFGTPTSLLYRADLVRAQHSFYPNPTTEADTSACFKYLRDSDFGFVHQILTYERVHEVRITTTAKLHNAYLTSVLGDLISYGSFYMTETEAASRLRELLEEYYVFLAECIVHLRDNDFWEFHKNRLKELGHPLNRVRLGKTFLAKLTDLALNPKKTAIKLLMNT